jgi:hypothetical protein
VFSYHLTSRRKKNRKSWRYFDLIGLNICTRAVKVVFSFYSVQYFLSASLLFFFLLVTHGKMIENKKKRKRKKDGTLYKNGSNMIFFPS